jgi:small subunit ribosomal protein S17
MPGRQKSLTGTIVSDKMDKTVIVLVETTTRHRLYRKTLKRTTRYMAHDDRLEAKPGDIVRIVETRPLSRLKRWRVAEIVQRGDMPEVAAREIDVEYLSRQREVERPPDAVAREHADEATEAPGAEGEVAPAGDVAESAEAPAAEAPSAEPDEPLTSEASVEPPPTSEEAPVQDDSSEDRAEEEQA